MAIYARKSSASKLTRTSKAGRFVHTSKLAGKPRDVNAASATASKAAAMLASSPSKGKQNREFHELAVPQQRAGFLIQALGTQSRVADLLEVSRSQPGKWSKGEESPSPERARELIDLDHVVARVVSWLGPEMTISWLNGSNAFLEGARPIDVLRARGSSEVVDAIDAEMSGAFA
jgi:hypothetical protein